MTEPTTDSSSPSSNYEGRRSRLEAALRAVEAAGNTLMAANIRTALQELVDADKG